MKKNKMMRIASFLLVAVLMSTCAISGTFAKYVTADTATDTARVAKWGMTIDLNNDNNNKGLFDVAYGTTVVSGTTPDQDNVVAPGTSASDKFTVNGTPETAYKVTFGFTKASEVFLKAGTYAYTNLPERATIDSTNDYKPIKWNVKLTTSGAVSGTGALTTATEGNAYDNMDALKQAIEATTITFATPNTACDVVITITWTWAFEGQDDNADTVLGDLAAGNTDLVMAGIVDGVNYELDVEYSLTITATQID